MTKTASGIHAPSLFLAFPVSLHAHHRCSRIAETECTSAHNAFPVDSRAEPGTLQCTQQANGCENRANPRRGCNASRVGCKTRPTAWKDDGTWDKTRRDASLFTVYAGLHMQSETAGFVHGVSKAPVYAGNAWGPGWNVSSDMCHRALKPAFSSNF